MLKRLKMTREEREQMRLSGDAVSLGWFFAVAICIGYFAGAWVDRRFGAAPWGTTIGVLLGIGAGFKNLVDLANRLSRAEDEAARKRRDVASAQAVEQRKPVRQQLDEFDQARNAGVDDGSVPHTEGEVWRDDAQ